MYFLSEKTSNIFSLTDARNKAAGDIELPYYLLIIKSNTK
jgi:hypothetical protein